MRWLGLTGRILGSTLLLGLVLLGLAIWPATVIDRGPTGTVRVSMFPLALTLFDPFVWTCVGNSLIIASLVACGSLFSGVGLALVGATTQFRGRAVLWSMAFMPMAAGPLLVAPGVWLSLGGPRAWEWLSARSVLDYPLDVLVRWVSLIWIGLITGAPIVALTASATLRKIEPVWIEAARLAGASRRQIWREILWPILRPEVAKASAAVFTLTLIEPAGPLILGLNRTLAMTILDSTIRLDQPTLPATLALMALVIVWAGRTMIGWWGGPTLDRLDHARNPIGEPANFRRAWGCRLVLVAWACFAVGPLGVLLLRSYQSIHAASKLLLNGCLEDHELHGWVVNSATTAGLALLVDLVILRTLLARRRDSEGSRLRSVSNLLLGIPPLALGVGAYATPWLLEALGDLLGRVPASWIRVLVDELNPARSPGFLLILVVGAGKLPILVKVADLAKERVSPALDDAATMMGVTDRRVDSRGAVGWLGFVPVRAVLLVFALASTNLAPALLMTPFSERRTIAPAILLSIVRDGVLDPRISLAVGAVLVWKLAAFAIASRSRVGSLGDWYRG